MKLNYWGNRMCRLAKYSFAAVLFTFACGVWGVPILFSQTLRWAAQNPDSQFQKGLFFAKSPVFWIMSEKAQLRGLAFAIRYKNNFLIDALLESGVPLDSTKYITQPLCEAAAIGDIEIAEKLIKRGAPINPDPNLLNDTPVWEAAFGDQPEMIRFLASKGADINAHATNVKSPLAVAIAYKKFKAAKALRELGARESTSKEDYLPIVFKNPKTVETLRALRKPASWPIY